MSNMELNENTIATYQLKLYVHVEKNGERRLSTKRKFVQIILTNNDILQKCDIESLEKFIPRQQINYLAHLIRKPDSSILKQLVFNNNKSKKQGRKISRRMNK